MPYVPEAPGAAGVVAHFDPGDPWQMSFGERTALIGLLSVLRPTLSVEIGTAQGGSLRRIAAVSEEVHSFDLVEPVPEVVEGLDHVTFHTGDSHALVPELLARFAEEGRNVDFAMVDGDHSADGVARDIRDLLDSPAVGRAVIVMHDSLNPEVRRGLDAVDYESYDKVLHVELDWVPGHVYRDPLEGELWGGLSLIVTDAERGRGDGHPAQQQSYHSSCEVALRAAQPAGADSGATARAEAAERRLAEVQADLDRARQAIADITGSPSWRATAPLRAIKRLVAR